MLNISKFRHLKAEDFPNANPEKFEVWKKAQETREELGLLLTLPVLVILFIGLFFQVFLLLVIGSIGLIIGLIIVLPLAIKISRLQKELKIERDELAAVLKKKTK